MSFDQTKALTSLEYIVGAKHILSNPSDMAGYLTDWRGTIMAKP